MKKQFLVSTISLLLIFLIGVSVVYAQDRESNPPDDRESNPGVTTIDNPFRGGNSLLELLKTLVDKILLPIGGMIAILAFIWTGFMYVKARGNPKELETAHRSLLYTSIGTAILLGAWTIASVIGNTIEQIKDAV